MGRTDDMVNRRRLFILPVALTTALALTATQAPANAVGSSAAPSTVAFTERLAVSADQVAADVTTLVAKRKSLESRIERDTSPTASRLVARVKQDVIDGRISVHLPSGAGIAGGDMVVWRDTAGARAVYLPYSGTAVRPSGLTVVYDAKGNRTAVSEQVYQTLGAESATAAMWVNGVLKRNVLVDASGAVAAAAKAPTTTDAHTLQSTFIQRLNDCLARQGVPNFIIAAIAALCTAVCVGTIGTACLACIAALGGSLGVVLDFCIQEAAS
ncbi:hypothetical protein ACTMTJ_20605 [Phytohabitans sp. LJ34]|uniref:hypothetical protein n=1 Tax=Phytohabitans sp. LJ34 TaxID=3452217 RepID=UPI003F8A78A9